MTGRADRWEERLRAFRDRADWPEWHAWGQRAAIPALAYLANGAKPVASIRGHEWRAITIGRQTVHWHTQSHYWQLTPPGPRWCIAGDGIVPLWMLVHDIDAQESIADITTIIATAAQQSAA